MLPQVRPRTHPVDFPLTTLESYLRLFDRTFSPLPAFQTVFFYALDL